MRTVFEDIVEGDLLECMFEASWIKNPVTAFYSKSYTAAKIKDGQVSFRIDGARYSSDEDCHSLPAEFFTKINLEIIGDDDEDCI
jgi:hypothetical protein